MGCCASDQFGFTDTSIHDEEEESRVDRNRQVSSIFLLGSADPVLFSPKSSDAGDPLGKASTSEKHRPQPSAAEFSAKAAALSALKHAAHKRKQRHHGKKAAAIAAEHAAHRSKSREHRKHAAGAAASAALLRSESKLKNVVLVNGDEEVKLDVQSLKPKEESGVTNSDFIEASKADSRRPSLGNDDDLNESSESDSSDSSTNVAPKKHVSKVEHIAKESDSESSDSSSKEGDKKAADSDSDSESSKSSPKPKMKKNDSGSDSDSSSSSSSSTQGEENSEDEDKRIALDKKKRAEARKLEESQKMEMRRLFELAKTHMIVLRKGKILKKFTRVGTAKEKRFWFSASLDRVYWGYDKKHPKGYQMVKDLRSIDVYYEQERTKNLGLKVEWSNSRSFELEASTPQDKTEFISGLQYSAAIFKPNNVELPKDISIQEYIEGKELLREGPKGMTSSVFWISDSFDRIYWSGTMQQRTEGKIEGTMLLSSVSIDEIKNSDTKFAVVSKLDGGRFNVASPSPSGKPGIIRVMNFLATTNAL